MNQFINAYQTDVHLAQLPETSQNIKYCYILIDGANNSQQSESRTQITDQNDNNLLIKPGHYFIIKFGQEYLMPYIQKQNGCIQLKFEQNVSGKWIPDFDFEKFMANDQDFISALQAYRNSSTEKIEMLKIGDQRMTKGKKDQIMKYFRNNNDGFSMIQEYNRKQTIQRTKKSMSKLYIKIKHYYGTGNYTVQGSRQSMNQARINFCTEITMYFRLVMNIVFIRSLQQAKSFCQHFQIQQTLNGFQTFQLIQTLVQEYKLQEEENIIQVTSTTLMIMIVLQRSKQLVGQQLELFLHHTMTWNTILPILNRLQILKDMKNQLSQNYVAILDLQNTKEKIVGYVFVLLPYQEVKGAAIVMTAKKDSQNNNRVKYIILHQRIQLQGMQYSMNKLCIRYIINT
ncbi:Hypothetical_protein [Hexamita inflata]|uniref:Hypothetical_protein n=1 Tax=Hexamita inflata TaxID=28002 RepID=A0ABP1LPE4_9EUKA